VQFSKSSLEPFTAVKHIVFGVNNNPQVQFTQVEKVIEVSHWGNVGITENYKLVNKGPSLKGEFSRVTFGSKGNEVRNAYKGIDFDLPYDIWGLYYLDEVGNISTSRAWRDDASDVVRVSLMPRFALLGGWKSNWELGYNFNTKGLLFHSGDHYEIRNLKLEYALERILPEQFKVKVVLPEGAQNVEIRIGGQVYPNLEVTRSTGYFDFNGRPTYVIPNFQGVFSGKDIDVSYDYSSSQVYKKPIVLSLIVLGFLIFAIFVKRVKLHAFAEIKEE
jgi:oligosaccharyltransferase complex subunit alpha (ribophorin I)